MYFAGKLVYLIVRASNQLAVTVPLFFVAELQESNVRLKLTIVDSVGFGDQINKEDRYVKKLYYTSC